MKGHEHLARPKPTLTDAYTHQWIRVDGATETAIPGATRGHQNPFRGARPDLHSPAFALMVTAMRRSHQTTVGCYPQSSHGEEDADLLGATGLPPDAWVRNWRAPRAKPGTRNASGSRRRRTGGSRRCSDSDDSACEAWRRCAASGTSCAWRLNIKRMGTVATG